MELINYDVDPVSGLHTLTHFDDGKMHVTYRQDLQANIDHTRAMRNNDDHWKRGVKSGLVQVGHIPNVVVSELLKIGVNVYRAPLKEIFAGLHRINKPHLITTTKRVC